MAEGIHGEKQEMLKDFSDKEQEILLDVNLLKQLDTLQQSDIAEKTEAINRIKQQLVSKQTVWDELEKLINSIQENMKFCLMKMRRFLKKNP